MKGDRVVVTGGAGFIGSHLADALLGRGASVCVVDDLSSGREENLAAVRQEIDFVRGDVRDPELLDRCFAGARFVFHQAAVVSVAASVEDPERSASVNLGGTLVVLQAARRCGVERVVFAASAAAYGAAPRLPCREEDPPDPRSPYALEKVAGEYYCRLYTGLYGLPAVALRYFNVYGPRQRPDSDYASVIPAFVDACLAGRNPVIYGDGGQTRDFVFVGDVVRANLLAATAPAAAGQVLNVASGRQVSLVELLAHVQAACGTALEAVHAAERPGDVRHSCGDPGRAAEVLGFRAEVDLGEGLRRTLRGLAGAAASRTARMQAGI